MGVADKNGFVELLDRQLGWRKKEIGELTQEATALYAAALPAQRLPGLRGGICLLYSHWEGFVRSGINMMLQHVRQSGATSEELVVRLRAAILLEYVTTNRGSMGLDACVAYIERGSSDLIGLIEIPAVGKLQGNLSFERFVELVTVFGISIPAALELKRNFINVNLLKTRNEIAHGEGRMIDLSEFTRAKDQVVELLDGTKTLLIDAALNETFRKAS